MVLYLSIHCAHGIYTSTIYSYKYIYVFAIFYFPLKYYLRKVDFKVHAWLLWRSRLASLYVTNIILILTSLSHCFANTDLLYIVNNWNCIVFVHIVLILCLCLNMSYVHVDMFNIGKMENVWCIRKLFGGTC